jgi:hypothetical protein
VAVIRVSSDDGGRREIPVKVYGSSFASLGTGEQYGSMAKKLSKEASEALLRGRKDAYNDIKQREYECHMKAIGEYSAVLDGLKDKVRMGEKMVAESLGAVRRDSADVAKPLREMARTFFLLGEEYLDIGNVARSTACYYRSMKAYEKLGLDYLTAFAAERAAYGMEKLGRSSNAFKYRVTAAAEYDKAAERYFERGMLKLAGALSKAADDVLFGIEGREAKAFEDMNARQKGIMEIVANEGGGYSGRIDRQSVDDNALLAETARKAAERGDIREAAVLYEDLILGMELFADKISMQIFREGSPSEIAKLDQLMKKEETDRLIIKQVRQMLDEIYDRIIEDEEFRGIHRGHVTEGKSAAEIWKERKERNLEMLRHS